MRECEVSGSSLENEKNPPLPNKSCSARSKFSRDSNKFSQPYNSFRNFLLPSSHNIRKPYDPTKLFIALRTKRHREEEEPSALSIYIPKIHRLLTENTYMSCY